ncbi:MAG TPA: molybdate ABC transporter substrate-binding protein [Nocardioidaceae bacterium]|nr:molybdate ABC transporter substrate-binding protein [Nocardioidaceae bacterium]
MSRRLLGLCLTALVATATACSGGTDSADEATLNVFAASSLTSVFTELETQFERDHEGVDVALSFDSSTTLATQIRSGAPADVLATADQPSMQILVDADMNAERPVPFAANTMAIVTPERNPAAIEDIDDLNGTDFVVCDPSAPCGAVAARILRDAGITTRPVSLEDKATAVLSKVTLGEVDAGIVYVTDAQTAGTDVTRVDIPRSLNEVTPYYMSVVRDSQNADLASDWASLVESEAGQDLLASAGFLPP